MSGAAANPCPHALPVRLDAIPAELRAIPQWVAWRWKHVPSQAKPWTKPPVNPQSGMNASTTDPATWGTIEAAYARLLRDRLPGLGLVLTSELRVVGGDVDACVDQDTGEIDQEALSLIDSLPTYWERSPSGSGLRFAAAGSLPTRINRGTKRGRYEIYAAARFLTFTGHRLPHSLERLESIQDALNGFCDATFPQQTTIQPTQFVAAASGDASIGEIIHRASSARNGLAFCRLFIDGHTAAYDSDDSRADEALCCHIAFYERDPARIDAIFRRSALMRPKWERADYRERTISRALGLVSEHYKPSAALILGRTAKKSKGIDFIGGKAVTR